jgi:acyl-CoA synthetase (AMP-forming)/AMP-acid ligase II
VDVEPPHPFPAELRPDTVSGLLDRRADERPEAVGLVAVSQAAGYRTLSFQTWRREAAQLAHVLAHEYGVQPGDRVAWLLGNRHGTEALVTYHAVARLAAVNVPINDRLTPREIAHILDHSGARALLAPERSREPVGQAVAALATPPATITVDGADGAALWALTRRAPEAPARPVSPRDDLCLVYTSGTTGTPKGVLHTHGSAVAAGLQWADAFRLTTDDALQSPFPIFGGGALHFNSLSALWAGASFVLEDFDPADTLRLMASAGMTVYVAVPSVYQLVLDVSRPDPERLRRVRILDYGGASMTPTLIKELRRAFPWAGLMQTYGLTEAGPGGIYLPEEYALARLGSVGNRPMGRYTRFRVVRPDGTDVGPDELGEFILTGPSLMKEYYRDPEATAAALRDGWLWTGDIVRVDEAGFVYHVDRRKDLVVRGGYNISSVEVEAVLARHPSVVEAAVVAKPHHVLGEDLKAYITVRPGDGPVDLDAIRAHCAASLADFKVPRDIEVVDELPRNAAGKVLKRVLRDRAARAGRPPQPSS